MDIVALLHQPDARRTARAIEGRLHDRRGPIPYPCTARVDGDRAIALVGSRLLRKLEPAIRRSPSNSATDPNTDAIGSEYFEAARCDSTDPKTGGYPCRSVQPETPRSRCGRRPARPRRSRADRDLHSVPPGPLDGSRLMAESRQIARLALERDPGPACVLAVLQFPRFLRVGAAPAAATESSVTSIGPPMMRRPTRNTRAFEDCDLVPISWAGSSTSIYR